MLTAPGSISDETANRLKADWEANFTGNNIGRLAILGDNLKYEAMTVNATDAQLIEQLKWTVEDVARCFHVPLYKIGGPVPTHQTITALNQAYYNDCLQSLVESMECCLDEGFALPDTYCIELEVDNLLRMDQTARYTAISEAIKGAWMAPNEGRKRENLPPVAGGNSPMIQEQNYSLAAIAKRDASPDPFGASKVNTPAANDPKIAEENKQVAAQIAEFYSRGLIENAAS
jgi:HK97 family phage portal protein